jgi:aspartyl-tRNA synthetase
VRLKRTNLCGVLTKQNADREVVLAGWVRKRRDHGGLIFVDLGDKSGSTQVVFNPEVDKETHTQARSLREGWVISVKGKVARRPKDSINPKLNTGEIELMVKDLEILNISEPLPFPPDDEIDTDEEVRLKYRYLDLRRPTMQKNMLLRYRLTRLVRDFLDKKGFIEIETPFLTKSTPEGARDYIVPSRVYPGEFYALPQSPQLLKQLLMVAGFDKYFQIVKCFRDEDLRADRQPEHTQIDIEASFVEEEDIYDLVENMLASIFKNLSGANLKLPFPRLRFEEAMERYGSDKPDTRFGFELVDVSLWASEGGFEAFRRALDEGGKVKGIRIPHGSSFSLKDMDELCRWIRLYGANGLSWILLTPKGIRSSLAKFFSEGSLMKVAQDMGGGRGDGLFFVAGPAQVVNGSLGQLRLRLAKRFNLIPQGRYEPLWVVDFPLFERDGEGNLTSRHHPFTSPRDEDLSFLEDRPEMVRARSYDVVINGQEVGGGSMRVHKRKIQEKILEILNINSLQAREKFGFLLDALSSGAPPHGGIALGLDRLLMLIVGAGSIRDVIPFPKTQKAVCLLTQAPSPVDERQLKELGLKVTS